jgi:hypothetical protein
MPLHGANKCGSSATRSWIGSLLLARQISQFPPGTRELKPFLSFLTLTVIALR